MLYNDSLGSTRVMARPVIHWISVMKMCWMLQCCHEVGHWEKIQPLTNGGHFTFEKNIICCYILLGEYYNISLNNRVGGTRWRNKHLRSSASFRPFPSKIGQHLSPFALCGRTIGQLATHVIACTVNQQLELPRSTAEQPLPGQAKLPIPHSSNQWNHELTPPPFSIEAVQDAGSRQLSSLWSHWYLFAVFLHTLSPYTEIDK